MPALRYGKQEETSIEDQNKRILKNKLYSSSILKDPRTVETKNEVPESSHKLIEGGPQPVILISMGRSGSSAIWDTMSTLTGQKSAAVEIPGSSVPQTKAFFDALASNGDFAGQWMYDFMLRIQNRRIRSNQGNGIVGFKWKPYPSFFDEPALMTLKAIAESKDPQVKVVRSRRNALDVYISSLKHGDFGRTVGGSIPAHCTPSDIICIEKHHQREVGMQIPVQSMLTVLSNLVAQEDKVDQTLDELGVPHVDVSYDLLFSDNHNTMIDEWNKIFTFLGMGPTKGNGLTVDVIKNAPDIAVTSIHDHNVTIENYEEVRTALSATPFLGLLH